MHGYGVHGWGMGIWWILGIVVLIVIIWIVVKAISRNNRQPHSGSNSALDVLKERYARGEIDKEEFEQRKKDLMQ